MGQRADEGLRRHPLPQSPQIQIPVPLAQPPAVGGQQHGHMGVHRVGKAKQRLQIHLPGGGAQKVHAPHHLGDTGLAVVHGDGQLVDINPIRPADHHIAAVRGKIHLKMALHQILNAVHPVRHPHTPGGGAVHGLFLGLRQIPAGSGVDISPVGQVRGIDAVELAAGAVAGVQQPLFRQYGKIPVIDRAPGALGGRLPVVVKAQPGKVLPQGFGIGRAGPLGVQILHPQHHLAVPAPDRQPGDEGREHVAQMHPPRGGGGKAAHRLHRIHRYHHQNSAASASSSRAMMYFSPL